MHQLMVLERDIFHQELSDLVNWALAQCFIGLKSRYWSQNGLVVVDPCCLPLPLLAFNFLSQVQLFCQVHLPLPGVHLPEVFPKLKFKNNSVELKNNPLSLVILIILLPRPRNPSNGELAAKILRIASYPVRIKFLQILAISIFVERYRSPSQ